jgi:hypothetical protein
MKAIDGQINLKAINNTTLPQAVSILSIIPNQNSANNNNLLYQYNLTGQNYAGVTSVAIQIALASNPLVLFINTAPVLTQNILGVVTALNTLNQGLFSYSGTTIYVSSDYYIYDKLQL